jgi:uncharacterized protein (DUF2249 family)
METPNWFNKAKIKISLDARAILARGEHPLERVLQESETLKPGEIYEIITPFPPMPMIEKLNAKGFESFSEKDDEGVYHTCFLKG